MPRRYTFLFGWLAAWLLARLTVTTSYSSSIIATVKVDFLIKLRRWLGKQLAERGTRDNVRNLVDRWLEVARQCSIWFKLFPAVGVKYSLYKNYLIDVVRVVLTYRWTLFQKMSMNFIAMIRFTDAIILTQNSSIFAFTSEKVHVILRYCNCKWSCVRESTTRQGKETRTIRKTQLTVFEFKRGSSFRKSDDQNDKGRREPFLCI